MSLLILVISLFGVWLGTELAVRSALRIAESYGLSQTFVGMTILAIGTDAPELVMSVVAGIEQLRGIDTAGVVMGSAVGSCIGQISLVLGIAGLSGYLVLGSRRVWIDGAMLLGSIVVVALVVFDGKVTRIEGAILLTTYVSYFVALVRRERGPREETDRPPRRTLDWFQCTGGLVLVTGFSYGAVRSALSLAEAWGLAQTVVGLLIVGLGTSLPELALSITAVRKRAGALSVGNIIGSNIFDMLVPPGTAALIASMDLGKSKLLWVDLPVVFGFSLMALIFFSMKRGLQRVEASALLIAYGAYVVARIFWTSVP